MNIHFYLDNEEETQITAFYDLASNPFKVDDELFLNVEEIYPVELDNFNTDQQRIRLQKDNNELEKKFRNKKVKIISEEK